MINDQKYVKQTINKIVKKQGYKMLFLHDHGRAYLGQLSKSNNKYYIKISKSKKENLLLQNSVHFSNGLEKLSPPFSYPKVLQTGNILGDFFYKIETEVKGKPLAVLTNDISILQFDKPEKYFQKITEIIFWLEKVDIPIPANFDKQSGPLKIHNYNKVTGTMIKWSYNETPRLSDLLKIVSGNKETLIKVTAHRDITPINLITSPNGSIGLIDADIIKKAPKYYDVAEFYNRLWTRICKPDLATKFLACVIENLKEDKDTFFNHLLPLLAFRSVGNYWETMQIKNNQKKRIKYLTSFANHVADKKFVT